MVKNLPDTARLNNSFPNVTRRSFGVSAMKVMVATLPTPAKKPKEHMRIESTRRRASITRKYDRERPTFRIRIGGMIMGTDRYPLVIMGTNGIDKMCY